MKVIPLQSPSLQKSTVAAAAAVCALLLFPMFGRATATTSTGRLKLVSADANLITRLDTKDLKQGERVTARLTSSVKTADAMDLPKGTVLIGKVEHVQTSMNKGPAKLSLVFDEARLRDGHTIPIKATLLGAYPGPSVGSYNYTGVGGPYIGLQSHFIPDDQRVDQEPGTLSHIAMHSAVQSPVSGVFTSKDRNIDLRRGTQFQLAIAATPKKG